MKKNVSLVKFQEDLKREGRPGDEATLTARLIDRPIRPLFPKGYRHDVQIMNTVLSDPDCSPEMVAMIGSSMALVFQIFLSKDQFFGVNVGYVDGKYVINPTVEERSFTSRPRSCRP